MRLKKQVHHAPRCPVCHRGLLDTFQGLRVIPCPECGTEVTPHECSYHISRPSALAVGLLLVGPMQFVMVLACQGLWVEFAPRRRYRGDQELAIYALMVAVAIHIAIGLYCGNWYANHQKYLSGSYCTPPGWAIVGTVLTVWTLTAAYMASVAAQWSALLLGG